MEWTVAQTERQELVDGSRHWQASWELAERTVEERKTCIFLGKCVFLGNEISCVQVFNALLFTTSIITVSDHSHNPPGMVSNKVNCLINIFT